MSQYSVIVFDNRGVGNSETPRGPYTCVNLLLSLVGLMDESRPMCRTSGMAEDIVALLDYVRWTEKGQIHVVGVSLGGMIAQGM